MFGSKGRKERKRLIALLLAGAMVLSGMGISPISVQAEETATAVEQVQETEPVETIVEEQGEETVSGGDIEVPEVEETEVLETEEISEVAVQAAEVTVPVVQNTSGNSDGYVLDAAELATFGADTKKDGDEETAGTDKYFTIHYSAGTKVEAKEKEFTDGYKSVNRINFAGAVKKTQNSISFTTTGKAKVKVYWGAADANREMAIINDSGKTIAVTEVKPAKDQLCCWEVTLDDAGTYYLGGSEKKNYIFRVEVTEGEQEEISRADWSTVDAPEITEVKQSGEKIDITVKAVVGNDGADKIVVTLQNEENKEVGNVTSSAKKDKHTVSITPDKSGTYTASVVATREGETDKAGNNKEVYFSLPLATPVISSATSKGNGAVEVVWSAVKEATGYAVTATAEGENEVSKVVTADETTALLEKLKVGKTYTISVVAVRGTENSEAGKTTVKMTAEAQRV